MLRGPWLRSRLSVLVPLSVLTLSILPGCSGSISIVKAPRDRTTSNPGKGGGPVTIPISLRQAQGSKQGARPMVEVRVGASQPVSVLLDTGSVGLHIFEPAIKEGQGSGVTVTARPDSIAYSGGSIFNGFVASAVVRVGSVATATAVRFGLIERASCTTAKPRCSTAGGIPSAMAAGEYGILGVAMQRTGNGIESPLLGMPGDLSKSWSIHLERSGGQLVLGAPIPAVSKGAGFQLRSDGESGAERYWEDSAVRMCFAVGSAKACTKAIFDTGTPSLQISGGGFDSVPTTGGKRVVTGLKVSVSSSEGSKPFWTFVTGSTKSADNVIVIAGRGRYVVCGVQSFFDFTITYDDVTGAIVLAPGG